MTEKPLAEIDFLKTIDVLIQEALEQGVTSLPNLILTLPSVDPSIVVQEVRRLANGVEGDTHIQLTNLLHEIDDVPRSNTQDCAPTPVPHPLNYDWRFTEDSISHVIPLLSSLTTGGDTAAFLGTPTAARAFALNSPNRVLLLDHNPRYAETDTPSNYKFTHWDARAETTVEERVNLVFADPPWYEEYFKLFLWTGSAITHLGGHCLLIFPPIGTRPGIAEEKETLIQWAQQVGLHLTSEMSSFVEYSIPPFERNTFRCLGIDRSVPNNWRRGDLLVFTKVADITIPYPSIPLGTQEWDDVYIQGVHCKLLKPTSVDNTFSVPLLFSLVPENILPTVSRRDPIRASAVLWTAGNRVLGSSNPYMLHHIMMALANEGNPLEIISSVLDRSLTSVETTCIVEAIETIMGIVSVELNEYALSTVTV